MYLSGWSFERTDHGLLRICCLDYGTKYRMPHMVQKRNTTLVKLANFLNAAGTASHDGAASMIVSMLVVLNCTLILAMQPGGLGGLH